MGGPVVAVRRDHRAVRQGPLDGRRLARPERRDRPRGLRARAAAQRAVRVPQHRRQEDVDLQGPRRGGAHDRRGHPAGAAPLPVPAPAPEPRHRVRPRRHRRRSRACSTSSTSSPRRRPAARSRASCRPGYEATFRYSLLDPDADVAAEAAAFRPAFAHLALLVQIPGVDVAARVEAEKGSPLTERERAHPRRAGRGGPRAGSRPMRPDRPRSRVRRRCLPEAAADLDDRAAAVPRGARGRRRARTRPIGGDAWQDADLRGRRRTTDLPAAPRVRGDLPRLPGPHRTDRAPAGSWPASTRRSSSSGCGGRRGGPRSEVPHERRPAAAPRRAGRHPRRRHPTRARTRRSSTARSSSTPTGAACWRERGAQGRAQRRLEADRRGDQGRRRARTAPRSPT